MRTISFSSFQSCGRRFGSNEINISSAFARLINRFTASNADFDTAGKIPVTCRKSHPYKSSLSMSCVEICEAALFRLKYAIFGSPASVLPFIINPVEAVSVTVTSASETQLPFMLFKMRLPTGSSPRRVQYSASWSRRESPTATLYSAPATAAEKCVTSSNSPSSSAMKSPIGSPTSTMRPRTSSSGSSTAFCSSASSTNSIFIAFPLFIPSSSPPYSGH